MHINQSFRTQMRPFNLACLEYANDVIYAIDGDFHLQYFNPAWIKFAQQNNGTETLNRFSLGSSVLASIPKTLKSFYQNMYAKVLDSRERVDHDYECSSPDNYRLFRQSVYPLKEKNALLITNHLVVEKPIEEKPHESDDCYFNEHQLVIQCAHCRKVKNQVTPQQWDWVPALVKQSHTNTSHTICPYCMEHYYPELDD